MFGRNFWSRLTLFFFLLLLEFANSFFSHISINHCNASRVSSAEGNPLMWSTSIQQDDTTLQNIPTASGRDLSRSVCFGCLVSLWQPRAGGLVNHCHYE